MKKWMLLIFSFLFFVSFTSEAEALNNVNDFKNGEYLKFKVAYLGITGGYATLKLTNTYYNGIVHNHAVGKGWTVGATKVFFKVDDLYETYINPTTLLPSKFIRKINEGGYTKDKVLTFNQAAKTVLVHDKKNKWQRTYSYPSEIQDMLSAFYYLRSQGRSNLSNGSSVNIKVFMDETVYNFKMNVLGRETVKTSLGSVKCIKLRPFVQQGRIFSESEAVTMWVTDDENLAPILVKAELVVGSLKAELIESSNLKTPINYF